MGLDINNEVMKAGELMGRYRMSKDDQLEVVRVLIACGVEHCLNEQEKVRNGNEEMVQRAFVGPGLIH